MITLPRWLIILDLSLIVIVLAALITLLILRLRLQKSIASTIEAWNLYRERRPSGLALPIRRLFSGTLEKRSIESGVNLLELFGLQADLVQRIQRHHKRVSKADIRRALDFSADSCLFPVFQSALKKRSVARYFRQWLESSGELFILRRLAIASQGAEFNGEKAAELLHDRIDELESLKDDPDYRVRMFAFRILFSRAEDQGIEAASPALEDGHAGLRQLAIELISFSDEQQGEKEQFGVQLVRIIQEDPQPHVRRKAAERLRLDFPNYELAYPETQNGIDLSSALRIAELLDPQKSSDQDLAFRFFEENDPELNLIAARFLDDCGALSRLFASIDPGDREAARRSEGILAKAAEFHCWNYLNLIRQPEFTHIGPLLAGSRIILHHGKKAYISELLKRVISIYHEQGNSPEIQEALGNGLEAALLRGGEEALMILGRTLITQKENSKLQQRMMAHIPQRPCEELIPPLFELLKDDNYRESAELISVLAHMPGELVLHRLIDIVREKGPQQIGSRKRALHVLLQRGEQAGIQHILEALPVLEIEEAKRCADWLDSFSEAELEKRLHQLFSSCDSQLRARIIAIVPDTLKKSFHDDIEDTLSDPDPEVRIAALHSLSKVYREDEFCRKHLYDPVPMVREHAAHLLASAGKNYEELNTLIQDPNETDAVKQSALIGAAATDSEKAAEFILSLLEQELEIEEQLIQAASLFQSQETFCPFVQRMKSAPKLLRERIIKVFLHAGEASEHALLSLLEEDHLSRDQVAEALEEIGTVDRLIRRLSARNSEERLNAAQQLSAIGTKKAFRGIILLVKDPCDEVRIESVKALQSLRDQKGIGIVRELTGDPLPRVRRYARWALERLEAEKL